MRRVGAGLLAGALLAFPLAAQGTGTLTGKVTEEGTNEAVQGASLIVTGTQLGALTRADGS
jgi:hypothetical protein